MSDDNNLQPDPAQPGNNPLPGGCPDVNEFLASVERAAELDARTNYRIGDNHMKLSQLVIANVAALKTANADTDKLIQHIKELSGNPT